MPPHSRQPDPEQELIAAKATIDQLLQQDVITAVQVFIPTILQALARIEAQDYAAYALIKSTLKGAKISMRDLSKAMQPYQPQLHVLHPDDPPPLRTAGDFLPDAPLPDLTIPMPYTLDDRATNHVSADINGLPQVQAIAYAPLMITGRLQHIDDLGQWLRLEWKRGDTWHTQDVDRGVALNANKLVDLASQGLPVATDNAGHVAHYLHLLEAENYQAIPVAQMATRLGWQGEQGAYGFLCGRTLARAEEILTIDDLSSVPTTQWDAKWIAFHGNAIGDEQIVDGFHQRGTYQAWCEAIQPIMAYPRMRIGLYASFAVPLLEILRIPNFILDWSARTSVGKTSTLRVVASPWGCPDELRVGESIVFSWNATKVWSERAASVMNGLPFILDESKLAAKGTVPSVLYMVANGIGKGRGTPKGLAVAKRWRTILFSTGEMPITGYSEDGGSRMRCLAIRGYPLGAKNDSTLKIVSELNAALCLNYGHAGPRFVQWLLQHRAEWGNWEARYVKQKQRFLQLNTDEASYRLSGYAASIALAAELVHEALSLPWARLLAITDELWTSIIEEASGAAGDVRALRDVMSWAWAHEESFYGRHIIDRNGDPRPPSGGWAGKWDKGEGWHEIAFLPTVLKTVLRECGYEPEAIITLWNEEGWLVRNTNDHHATKVVHLDNGKARMYAVERVTIELVEA
jgi:putative DNA primase/helicase